MCALCGCVHVYMFVGGYVHVCMCVTYMHTCAGMWHTFMSVGACVRVWMCVCMCMCTYLCAHVCIVCTCVHAHMVCMCVYMCAVPLESEKKSCMLTWTKYLYTNDKICYSQNIGICTTYITKKLLA